MIFICKNSITCVFLTIPLCPECDFSHCDACDDGGCTTCGDGYFIHSSDTCEGKGVINEKWMITILWSPAIIQVV